MKRWFSLAAALLMLFAFSACGEAPPSDTLPTVQPIGIVDMLTAEQIYGATGLRFGAAQQASADEVAYFTQDQSAAVYIAAKRTTAEEYEAMIAALIQNGSKATVAPNLSERAVWFSDALDLLVFTGTYALDVRVEYATPRPDDSLLAARQLAALLCEQL